MSAAGTNSLLDKWPVANWLEMGIIIECILATHTALSMLHTSAKNAARVCKQQRAGVQKFVHMCINEEWADMKPTWQQNISRVLCCLGARIGLYRFGWAAPTHWRFAALHQSSLRCNHPSRACPWWATQSSWER
jgi:hypothetical protein